MYCTETKKVLHCIVQRQQSLKIRLLTLKPALGLHLNNVLTQEGEGLQYSCVTFGVF